MRAERLISLMMVLQRGREMTAGELAQRLEVSVRTIFRDIDALSGMGVPVYTEPGRGGGIRLMEGYSSDLTGLSSGEAEALALIASPAGVAKGLAGPTRSALDKLAAAVPSMHQLRAQHARGRLLFDTKPWFRSTDVLPFLDELRAYTWKNEKIEIAYQRSDGEFREYAVEPYALVVKVDVWYLIGKVKEEFRVFRLSRLQSVKATNATFQRDAKFDLQKYWGDWCEKFEKHPPSHFPVQIELSARGRKRILDEYCGWFASALRELPEQYKGRKPVTLDFDKQSMAMRVMFDLGDEARVIHPAALRRALHEQAVQVARATRPTKVSKRLTRAAPFDQSAVRASTSANS
jgi:predicted DNA-binding transcriptional regulator YafY